MQKNSDDNLMFQKLITKFGVLNQALKCVEELGELTLALTEDVQRYLNPTPLKKHNVAEEIADVQIMIDQMKLIHPEWESWYSKKIIRIQNLLSDENNK